MSVEPFSPDELVEWVEAELETPAGGYTLADGEYTVDMFHEILVERRGEVSRDTARRRLNAMVKKGLMAVRREVVKGRRRNVYWRSTDD